ncbi:MptD family putative ECF transporter S component [Paenibacillus apiarius]|uniref:MptD family putative ECF transporter S component n=1 Tax=Paenibacillus apiarius TaxID=46240 RepID=UPI003B3B4DFC
MQTQTAAVQNSWKMRDFITLSIFNVVMILIFTIGFMFTSVLLTPAGSYLAGAGIIAIINGPIYMVMSNKIDKRGVLFFTSLITGLYFTAFGYAYFLVTLAAAGVICEIAMWGQHTYRHPVRNAIGYSIFNIGFSLCGVMPIVFFKQQYEATLSRSMSAEQVAQNLYYYGTPSMVLLMCVISLVGALAGCAIGNQLLRKHVKKAKLV